MAENYDSTYSESDDTFQEPDTGVNEGSPLAALKAAVEAKVENEDLQLVIPKRPTLRAVYSSYIDGDKFQAWQTRCRIKKTENIDIIRFSGIVLANQLKGIEVRTKNKWVVANGSDGEPLNFQHDEFRDLLLQGEGFTSAVQLVRKLYGNDGALMQAATEVVTAAGYGDQMDGDELDIENPTMT